MKPAAARGLVIAVAALLILLDRPVFSQMPTPQTEASGETAAVSDTKTATETRAVTDLRRSIEQTRKTPETIGFFSADIFRPSVKPERLNLRYASTVPPQTVSTTPSRSYDDLINPAWLAKELRNPVSPLARISFESNFDFGLSANREGYRYTMMFEPVAPIKLSSEWNLILRTRMPLIQQDGVEESMLETGLGDTIQSFFFSPSDPGAIFWGAGGALLIPTATNRHMGAGKFGIGPSVAVGRQQGGWTYGVLARHIWSVAGEGDRPDVSATFIQPFASYTTRSAWSMGINAESTYDWMTKEWATPVHFELTKVIYVGRHPVSVGGALRCWVASHTGGPQACGFRLVVTPIFPGR